MKTHQKVAPAFFTSSAHWLTLGLLALDYLSLGH